jgi:leucyl aminopeptidase
MKISVSKTVGDFKGLVLIPFFESDETIHLTEPFGTKPIPKALFSAKKDTQHIFSDGDFTIALIGLGTERSYKSIQTAFRRLTAKRADLFEQKALLFAPDFGDYDLLEACITGLLLGTYRLGHLKTDPAPSTDFGKAQLAVYSSLKGAKNIIERAEKIAAAQVKTLTLVDLPPNKVTPEYLAEWAKEAGKKLDFEVKVIGKTKAEKEKLHAFLAVGQGSQREPQFIIMKYRHKNAKKHLGLVGKGVTFDTGGLNIKTQGMVHMKSDMAGAAAVLGVMHLAADLGLEADLTAVVPCVENAVDSHSLLPSDVIESYSGKTIEIIDTDAEGRLILADALSYLIKNFKPDAVVDFATLTGSVIGTFGYECAGLFTKDDSLSQNLQQAGAYIGEKLWPLPMWDAYKTEMDSEIADIKNFHGKPYAGAITAAKFLEFFTSDHPSWAHIDIAGTAFGDSEFAKTKHATAFGVHLMLKFIENL